MFQVPNTTTGAGKNAFNDITNLHAVRSTVGTKKYHNLIESNL